MAVIVIGVVGLCLLFTGLFHLINHWLGLLLKNLIL
jgi:hypothetical protein